MSDELTIEFKWLGGQTGSAVDRACYADIGLVVGAQWLTLLEDLEACTVSKHLRGSAHQLAMWFAANWWRLRWEPEIRDWSKDADWRIAHSVAAAGGGYVWPNVLFASDGDSVAVASRPRLKAAAFEPIRYLNRIDAHITATEFENKVDAFVTSVLARLNALGIEDEGLPGLWAEVLAERAEPATYQRRKLEAIAGYDPDEIPDELLARLVDDQDKLGRSAIEEVVAEARHRVDEALQPMREASRSRKPKPGGFRATLPGLEFLAADDGSPPWRRAAKLARQARKEWGLGNKPIRNKLLADLLVVPTTALSDRSLPRTTMPFAMRQGTNGKFDIYVHSPISANRRFAVSRMIGDHLHCASQEKLLPATRAGTGRQKFQRAFAQELLCPYEALLEKIQTEQPNEDDIAEAAEYFHVSQLLVRTTLVNKGELDRTALAWGDQ